MSAASATSLPADAPAKLSPVIALLLAALTVAAVWLAGSSRLDAPWMGGDEVEFIAKNSTVTADADLDGTPDRDTPPLSSRVLGLFVSVQQDLYQPIPIATYAIEW